MDSTSENFTSYKMVVAALCAVLSIICLLIIYVCMMVRKDKTYQRGYLHASISILLLQLSMACVSCLAEQFFIIENLSMSVGIVIIQTFFSVVFSIFIFLFIAPRKKTEYIDGSAVCRFRILHGKLRILLHYRDQPFHYKPLNSTCYHMYFSNYFLHRRNPTPQNRETIQKRS